jgi:hypothetical protein
MLAFYLFITPVCIVVFASLVNQIAQILPCTSDENWSLDND